MSMSRPARAISVMEARGLEPEEPKKQPAKAEAAPVRLKLDNKAAGLMGAGTRDISELLASGVKAMDIRWEQLADKAARADRLRLESGEDAEEDKQLGGRLGRLVGSRNGALIYSDTAGRFVCETRTNLGNWARAVARGEREEALETLTHWDDLVRNGLSPTAARKSAGAEEYVGTEQPEVRVDRAIGKNKTKGKKMEQSKQAKQSAAKSNKKNAAASGATAEETRVGEIPPDTPSKTVWVLYEDGRKPAAAYASGEEAGTARAVANSVFAARGETVELKLAQIPLC